MPMCMRGKALATIGDCIACHTAPGGKPFAGGFALQTPFGPIMTPNHHAGRLHRHWPLVERRFCSRDARGTAAGRDVSLSGVSLSLLHKVTRSDVEAIYDYLRTLAPVSNPVNRRTLPFPFSIRLSMWGWNALFFTPGYFVADPKRSEEFNRGAYLVEGLGHCGACHTPLNAFGANKADQYLQGNQIDNWIAPNITNDPQAGLGNWSTDDIVQYLKNGQTRTSLASGPMKDVIENSTSKMPDADLKAIAVYLKERGAAGTPAPAPLPATDPQMQVGQGDLHRYLFGLSHRSGAGVERHVSAAGRQCRRRGRMIPSSLVHIILTGARATRHRREADIAGDALARLSPQRQPGGRRRHLYPQQLGQCGVAGVGRYRQDATRQGFLERRKLIEGQFRYDGSVRSSLRR